MSAKKKRPVSAPTPAPAQVPSSVVLVALEPFYKSHPKIANAIFAALCVYVAMIWLLALDQTFHWGIFGPKVLLTP